MSARRAAVLLAFVAVAAFANSIGNGFAYDDNEIVLRNPTVVAGRVLDAFATPYWPEHAPGTGLYRPVTVASFALEWPLWNGDPRGFHAVNVLLHAGVTLLVFALLLGWVSTGPAAVGAAWFAIHPVHTEAVANLVGRAELWAALFVLAACLCYDRVRATTPAARAARLLAITLCYLAALGSKEIAVTLPGLLVLIALARDGGRGLARRLRSDAPVFVALAAALGIFLAQRVGVLGSLLGETAAPELQTLGTAERLRFALALWPEYLRLLFVPFDLVADYSPAVLLPPDGWSADVWSGLFVLAGLVAAATLLATRAPLAALAIAWFGVAISPVSQVLFATGVALAERTLYLPSVAVALLGAAAAQALLRRVDARRLRLAGVAALLFGLALLVRTVDRNPSWLSTYTVLNTLAAEHPESTLALRSRGTGLARAGDVQGALASYAAALELSPRNYALLTEVGHFQGEQARWDAGEALLRQALALAPDRPHAYRLLASQYLMRSRFREAHGLAVEGWARAGADRELFAIVSESYVAKGDFPAALRARRAALAQAPDSRADWSRLAEILEMAGDSAGAAAVRGSSASRMGEASP
ncbi:MAG: hypothetical protein R3E98_05590 [Gemmatimonadota bacterium]|nr:hypothetical protein [Gemmatimonadota bacterium]